MGFVRLVHHYHKQQLVLLCSVTDRDKFRWQALQDIDRSFYLPPIDWVYIWSVFRCKIARHRLLQFLFAYVRSISKKHYNQVERKEYWQNIILIIIHIMNALQSWQNTSLALWWTMKSFVFWVAFLVSQSVVSSQESLQDWVRLWFTQELSQDSRERLNYYKILEIISYQGNKKQDISWTSIPWLARIRGKWFFYARHDGNHGYFFFFRTDKIPDIQNKSLEELRSMATLVGKL